MKTEVKSGVEYALISLLAVGLCLWQLISGANEPDPSPARMTLMALGLVVSGAMHVVFMMQLVRRTGRSFWPWLVAVLLFFPLGTAVLLAMLLGESEMSES
ncbi:MULTISPECIES: hypothetical protein [unclassified Roseateles]|jgi:hypothetical protein|uniref:hypothetical protein n=1 Tax=unclassified Roseateles TaxID=2626991 RepID=UPI0006F50666|nr:MULTISPECIES: hypothetical protein [unclassified Roseateles]KQW42872.1 hypothetical protein ASC81_19665 [Pelomonas sp. Root405]KRA69550.1 hypothetical protein ASD88_20315 [Pelomonas sp. Root662]